MVARRCAFARPRCDNALVQIVLLCSSFACIRRSVCPWPGQLIKARQISEDDVLAYRKQAQRATQSTLLVPFESDGQARDRVRMSFC
jgi:hypothetical protein